jgi:hypothetical protein
VGLEVAISSVVAAQEAGLKTHGRISKRDARGLLKGHQKRRLNQAMSVLKSFVFLEKMVLYEILFSNNSVRGV